MTNNNLIPFSKELWESGEYEVVTRCRQLAKVYDFIGGKILGSIDGYVESWSLTGSYLIGTFNSGESSHDLMLRKKTKKVWIPTWKNTVNYATKKECEADNSDDPCFSQAIEVEI